MSKLTSAVVAMKLESTACPIFSIAFARGTQSDSFKLNPFNVAPKSELSFAISNNMWQCQNVAYQ